MRKVHRTKELDQLQKIKKENEQLKREISKLRKQMARMPNRLESLEYLAKQQKAEAEEELNQKKLSKLKDQWKCWECGRGYLRLVLFPRRDGVYYYRQCTLEGCGHRTKLKPHNSNVEGVEE